MATVNPDPSELGLASPQLGPWFTPNVDLGVPDPSDLSVAVSNVVWLPPAAGTLSLIVPKTNSVGEETLHHRSLVRLRNAGGEILFVDQPDVMVALFTLLPEVVARLRQLYLNVELLGDAAGNRLRRPLPTQFALTFEAPADLPALNGLVPDVGVSTAEHAAMLGLSGDGPFTNGDLPMAWLRRPGELVLDTREKLIDLTGKEGKLFAFDELGLPIDPGAVASAFQKLLADFTNLEAPGAVSLPTVPARRMVHWIDPMGGPTDPSLRALVQQTGPILSDDGHVRTFEGPLDLSLSVPTLEDRPFLRLSFLPSGPYGTSARLGGDELMPRDFVRVGLTDLEVLLAGASRTDSEAPNQVRPSTRVNLAPSSADPTLLPNHEATLAALRTLLDGQDPATVISAAVEGATGPLTADDLPAVTPPDEILGLTLQSVRGGAGPDTPGNPGWAAAMQALVQVHLPDGLAGAWVRVMPLDFDLDTGERKRLAGGGGRAIEDGGQVRATVLLTLPPGEAQPDEDEIVAFDVEIVTQEGKRLIGTQTAQRIARPPATPGAIAIAPSGAFPGGVEALYVCETGQRIPAAVTALRLPSGLSVIAELPGDEFAVLNTRAAPYSLFEGGIGTRLSGADTLVITARVWKEDPPGDDAARLSSTGATVLGATRDGVETLIEAGAPLPLLERYDVLGSTVGDGRATAVIGTVPLVDRYHELSPARPGRADEPSASEVHATGVRLDGPAAVLAAEYARDRRFAGTDDLLSAVTNTAPPTPPAVPGAPGPVVVLLRTVAAEVEGERQMHLSSNPALPSVAAFPFGGSVSDRRAWFTLLGITGIPVPANVAAEQRFLRAADRRVLGATQGYAEAAPVIIKLISSAQRFIYLETPELDAGVDIEGEALDDAEINVIAALRARLLANPDLHVVVCLPREIVHPFVGVRRFRSHMRSGALARLRGEVTPDGPWSSTTADRVAVFASYAAGTRPLRIVSTTLIVDDVIAVTGSMSLSRRGLTFDSSLAAAVFDERLTAERSTEVFRFRQRLVSDRLGEKIEHIPADGRVLTTFVQQMLQSPTRRAIATPAEPVDDSPGNAAAAALDPDGRASSGFNVAEYLAALILDTDLRNALA